MAYWQVMTNVVPRRSRITDCISFFVFNTPALFASRYPLDLTRGYLPPLRIVLSHTRFIACPILETISWLSYLIAHQRHVHTILSEHSIIGQHQCQKNSVFSDSDAESFLVSRLSLEPCQTMGTLPHSSGPRPWQMSSRRHSLSGKNGR